MMMVSIDTIYTRGEPVDRSELNDDEERVLAAMRPEVLYHDDDPRKLPEAEIRPGAKMPDDQIVETLRVLEERGLVASDDTRGWQITDAGVEAIETPAPAIEPTGIRRGVVRR